MKIFVFSAAGAGAGDGVGDYAALLAQKLAEKYPVRHSRNYEELAAGDILWIHYVPQAIFSRPDGLSFWRWLLRSHKAGVRILVTFHEFDIPWSWAPRRAGAWFLFRMAAVLLLFLCDAAAVTYAANGRKLAKFQPGFRRRIEMIPACAVIDPERIDTVKIPGQLALFAHPAALDKKILKSFFEWFETRTDLKLVWLGAAREQILQACPPAAHPRVEIPGFLPAEQVSRRLAQSAVMIAPVIDGVSTRRTTVAAGLAHGLPVVGTDGPCTENLFRQSSAFLLSGLADGGDCFVRNLEKILTDEPARKAMSEKAAGLYENFLSPAVISRQYEKLLAENFR